jgi:TctA family transporter
MMDFDMMDSAFLALQNFADLKIIFFLVCGVFIGLILGVIPGLGGLTGLSLLLPLAFTMDPIVSIVFIMGLYAVTTTSDTIPAVLFGVPGTIGSAATTVDGHPMAKNGEAGRALGAAFSASAIGGIFGAMLLAISVPILQPIVLGINSPQLFAICIFSISLIAILSGNSPIKGIVVGLLGIVFAFVGEDSQGNELRWTFNLLYLYEGIPLIPAVVGLFAIPEIVDLLANRKNISDDKIETRKGQFKGIKDVLENWFLVLRCSALGSILGSIPGIGAAVIDWLAYGHGKRTVKNNNFGKGDVRGVIAPEAANNAKEGGALIPTISFGIPGSAGMVLVLAVFYMHGYVPGPEMLTTNLSVTYTMVWALTIANIIGAGICFLFADQLSKITLIRMTVLAPLIMSTVFIGAIQGSQSWEDLVTLVLFGFLGWLMKEKNLSRPVLTLGFVLGGLIESYYFRSVDSLGYKWLLDPIVLGIFAVTIYGLLMTYIKRGIKIRLGLDYTMFIFLGIFAAGLFSMSSWTPISTIFPTLICGTGIILSLISVSLKPEKELDIHWENTGFFVWLLGYLGLSYLIGMLPAIIIFVFAYTRSWKITIIFGLFCYTVFHEILQINWPESVYQSVS